MGFQVLPEEQAELVGQAVHRHVVDAGPTLVQVVGQQVPDRAAGQVIVVDQLPGGQLAADVRVEHPGPGRGARRQEARRVQQLVRAAAGRSTFLRYRCLPWRVHGLPAVRGSPRR